MEIGRSIRRLMQTIKPKMVAAYKEEGLSIHGDRDVHTSEMYCRGLVDELNVGGEGRGGINATPRVWIEQPSLW